MSDNIKYEEKDGTATLTFDRPEKKNAITNEMYGALNEGLDKASANKDIRVLLIQGEGPVFTAGNDLMDFAMLSSSISPDNIKDTNVIKFLYKLVGFEKPLVVKVRGPAVGIGTTLLLHADVAYASNTARFHMPFTSLGLVPEGGSSFLLPRVVGHRHASALLLLAEKFDARKAREVGLVNEVIEDDQLDAHVEEVCKRFLNLPAASLRASKKLLRDPIRKELEHIMAEEAKVFAARLTSPESAEAFASFMEKRAPNFRQFDA